MEYLFKTRRYTQKQATKKEGTNEAGEVDGSFCTHQSENVKGGEEGEWDCNEWPYDYHINEP